MGNDISVKYKGERVATIKPDTPSLEELKTFVIRKRDNMDVKQIRCECDTEGFDGQYLEEALRQAIQEELEKLKLEKKAFEDKMRSINEVSH